MPYCFLWSSIKFQGHKGWKIDDLNPICVRLLGRSQLSNPSDLPCFLFVLKLFCIILKAELSIFGFKTKLWFLMCVLIHCYKTNFTFQQKLTHWLLGYLNEIIFKLLLVMDWSCEIALRWLLLELAGDISHMVPTDLEKCLNWNAILKSAWFFNQPWKWEIFLEKCLKMSLWCWKI